MARLGRAGGRGSSRSGRNPSMAPGAPIALWVAWEPAVLTLGHRPDPGGAARTPCGGAARRGGGGHRGPDREEVGSSTAGGREIAAAHTGAGHGHPARAAHPFCWAAGRGNVNLSSSSGALPGSATAEFSRPGGRAASNGPSPRVRERSAASSQMEWRR